MAGREAPEGICIHSLLEHELEVFLGEVEMGEPVLIHEFDDVTDFLEVHDVCRLGLSEQKNAAQYRGR